ncbi:MAG TPA: DUF1828 domain-containing protein [Chthoniobacterales bacterium]|nr:DUF1828 domain-containing protein [Chthoniobacterales bacterium]
MTRAECERLIADYLRWLREGIRVSELGSGCHVATPFLDRHNDEIEIYVEKTNGGFLLTDDGYTVSDLEASGMIFSTEKRRAHLDSILNGFGIRLADGELQVVATAQDFAQKKHSLIQAMLAVNDMFVMGQEHVFSLFREDVSTFLEKHAIPAFPDFKLTGKSGFDHKFDFGIPRSRTKPQRVVRAINDLTKDQALSFAFAVADVRAMRADTLQALSFINDVDHPINDENVSAMQAYDILPVRWSARDAALPLLNGTLSQ